MDNGTMAPGPDFSRGRPLFCGHKIRSRGNGKWTRLIQFPFIARTHNEKCHVVDIICFVSFFFFFFCRLSHNLCFLGVFPKCHSLKKSISDEGYTNLHLFRKCQKNAFFTCFAMHRPIPTTICRRRRLADCGRKTMVSFFWKVKKTFTSCNPKFYLSYLSIRVVLTRFVMV